MKHFSLFITTISTIFLLSGCISIQGNYKPEYISKNLNTYLSKVEQQETTVIVSHQSIKKRPTGYRGSGVEINMQTGQILTNVQKEFFLEYFNKVNLSNKVADKGLTLESEIVDYEYHYIGITDGAEMTMKVKVTFYKDGIKKFTKIYESTESNKVFMVFNAIVLGDQTIELFHKQLLKIFETSVKRDMIHSL